MLWESIQPSGHTQTLIAQVVPAARMDLLPAWPLKENPSMGFLVGEEIHLKSGLSPVACPGCSYPVYLISLLKPHQKKQNSVTSDISIARDDYGLGPVLMLHISFYILTSASYVTCPATLESMVGVCAPIPCGYNTFLSVLSCWRGLQDLTPCQPGEASRGRDEEGDFPKV